MQKKKILFFTRNNNYFLNDLNNVNFFSKISKDYNCTFYFTEKNYQIHKDQKVFCTKNRFRHILWTIITILVNGLAIKKETPKNLQFKIDKFCFHTQNNKLLFLINIIRKIRLEIFTINFFKFLLKTSNEFKNNEKKQELILIYDGALSLESFDIINYANKNNIKSILIINNWDNSTKCHLINPTLVLSWGKRSKEIIEKNFNLNCNAIGTPRLDHFFKNKKKNKLKKINRKFIKVLFAGSIIPQNDFSLLKKIDTHVKNKNYKIKIIFRPHPFGFFENNLLSFQKEKNRYQLKSVEFDKNLLKKNNKNQKLNYSNFSKIDGLICSFSTLTLECAINNLPCLCYAINDEKYKYYKLFNHEISCKYAEHLLLLNKYNWPIKAFGENIFLKKFDKLISNIISGKKNKIIKYILKQEVEYSRTGYYQRLKKQIDYI
jgi:hypothetical protein